MLTVLLVGFYSNQYMGFIAILLLELFFLFALSHFLIRSLSMVLVRLTKSTQATVGILAVIFFPGVVIHELSHMVAAGVCFVPVGEMSLYPVITKDGVRLGSVAIGKTDPLRRAIIGFAPVFAGLLIIVSIVYFFTHDTSFLSAMEDSGWKNAVFFFVGYVLFVVSNTMFSSKKDMEGAIELLVGVVVLCIVAWLLGVRVEYAFFEALLSGKGGELFQKAGELLLIPLLIDMAIYLLARIVLLRWR